MVVPRLACLPCPRLNGDVGEVGVPGETGEDGEASEPDEKAASNPAETPFAEIGATEASSDGLEG
jgi:hypothetical protein